MGSTSSAPSGGSSPTWCTRPVPVRQEARAPGAVSSPSQTRPAAVATKSVTPPCQAHPALVQHDDALAQRGDVLGLVGGDEHGRPVPGRRQHAAQGRALLGVEAGRRLVEHQQVGIAHQGLGEGDAVPLAARQPTQPLAGEVGEPDQLQHPAHLRCRAAASDHSFSAAT